MGEIAFKSYCWSIGTTSYRTGEMNLSIERQLEFMSEFRNIGANKNSAWRDLQEKYYYYLKDKGFLVGNASRPDKDARQKTSGLVDIGLLDDDRNLTKAGHSLLNLCNEGDFSSKNFLEIAEDSFIYLKQLLKTANIVDGKTVRPFIVLAKLLNFFGELSKDEFMYFLPLCIDDESTSKVISYIASYRNNNISLSQAIYEIVANMENYQSALQLLLDTNEITPTVICAVGFNRKSSSGEKSYDTIFFDIYNCLVDIYINKNDSASKLFALVKQIRGNTKTLWKKVLFGTNQEKAVEILGLDSLISKEFAGCNGLDELKTQFFIAWHTCKIQATLKDYADLNKRYFKLSDCLLFRDSKVQFDIIPKVLFSLVDAELYKLAFVEDDNLIEDVNLDIICSEFATAENKLYAELSKVLGVAIADKQQAHRIINDERYVRLNQIIDSKFGDDNLINLLEQFEERKDKDISTYITDNASIPTLFEYVVGISWYKISERKGDILDYMNLSLDADLMPKTHAGGGMADIVYKYEKEDSYPKHTLLIEATLSEKVGQRSMEMEPVSRHLGEYLSINDEPAYSLFIPTYLNSNIVSDFRMRKQGEYYANNSKTIDGMKIIPLQTSELKSIIKNGYSYGQVYNLFETAYQSEQSPRDWYKQQIENMI